jgi:hypothetical protein
MNADFPIRYIDPVFRPPSEADSLILPVTDGCSWNHCSFCEMYTAPQKKFRARDEAETMETIRRCGERFGAGVRRVFLADGDALVLPTRRLLQILSRDSRTPAGSAPRFQLLPAAQPAPEVGRRTGRAGRGRPQHGLCRGRIRRRRGAGQGEQGRNPCQHLRGAGQAATGRHQAFGDDPQRPGRGGTLVTSSMRKTRRGWRMPRSPNSLPRWW